MSTTPFNAALFRWLFLSAALWNLIGAVPGYFFTEQMFEAVFARELDDPLMALIYRGSWGTSVLYFFGYLMVARDPARHSAVVLLGGLGKVFFAKTLVGAYLSGLTSPTALIIITGDIVFVALFAGLVWSFV